MILRKSDELLLHNKFLSLCWASALEACDFFPKSSGGGDCITSWDFIVPY